jgi:hypothetical protein
MSETLDKKEKGKEIFSRQLGHGRQDFPPRTTGTKMQAQPTTKAITNGG